MSDLYPRIHKTRLLHLAGVPGLGNLHFAPLQECIVYFIALRWEPPKSLVNGWVIDILWLEGLITINANFPIKARDASLYCFTIKSIDQIFNIQPS